MCIDVVGKGSLIGWWRECGLRLFEHSKPLLTMMSPHPPPTLDFEPRTSACTSPNPTPTTDMPPSSNSFVRTCSNGTRRRGRFNRERLWPLARRWSLECWRVGRTKFLAAVVFKWENRCSRRSRRLLQVPRMTNAGVALV